MLSPEVATLSLRVGNSSYLVLCFKGLNCLITIPDGASNCSDLPTRYLTDLVVLGLVFSKNMASCKSCLMRRLNVLPWLLGVLKLGRKP